MLYNKKLFALAACCMLALTACGQTETASPESTQTAEVSVSDNEEFSANLFAMDTSMDLKIYGGGEAVLEKAEAEINRIDAAMSKTAEGSEVWKINSGETDNVSDEAKQLLSAALEVSAETDGAFDITVAPMVELWGFVDKNFKVPTEAEIEETLKRVDYTKISVNSGKIEKAPETQIDLGGIAKGYTSDRVISVFRENGVKSAIISLGGNVQTLGTKPDGSEWNVAVQNPNEAEDQPFIGVVQVSGKAVVTSGAYQRFFEENGRRWHHIIDPETGYPAENGLISVSIICDSGRLADALSTSLYIMGFDRAAEFWRGRDDFEAVLETADEKIYVTEGIADKFTSKLPYEVISK